MASEDVPTILIVDDDPAFDAPYDEWLRDFQVRHVETGADALQSIDDAVEVVLLDRAVPDTDEETLLATIRDQGLDCRVVLITPADPGVHVMDRGFDEYITKPIDRSAIRETVDRLLDRVQLDDELGEYFSLVQRRKELEAEYGTDHLDDHEEYQQLCDRIAVQEAEVGDHVGDLSSESEFVGTVKEIAEEDPDRGEGDADEW